MRVRLLIQYLWRDDGVGNNFSGWQSGLYGYDGRPKPLSKAFANPFWVDLPRGSRAATVWGQVRPGGASQVTIQRRLGASTTWKPLTTLTTDQLGYFSLKQTVTQTTSYRFRYTEVPALAAGAPALPQAPKLITSSAWTVKPVSAKAARHRRR